MPVAIYKATAKDVSLLVGMMREFYSESNYSLDQQWAVNSFAALLHNTSYGTIWVASYNGNPVGYIVLTVRFSMEHGGLEGFIDDLFVCPGYRQRGVGQALLKMLFAECKQRKALALQVEVGSDNAAAKSLYRKNGLRVRVDDRQVLTAELDEETDET